MIGTPNGYFSTSHSSFHAEANRTESTADDQKHYNGSRSPVEDRKYFSTYSSPITNTKEQKNYGWPSYNVPLNYSTYDNNENVTNAPLNLSLNCNDSIEPEVIKHATPQLLSLPNSTPVAQLILTSGQMVQGIQGAQLFVPTSQGLAKQIVLTIPITHVTTDQVINLSLTDGQIIPTTVGELLKLAMPKSLFKDDVTGEKIINQLMKLSEQNSVCIAEYLKSALKHNEKFYKEEKQNFEPESESGAENETKDEKPNVVDEKPDIKSTDLCNEHSKLSHSRRKHTNSSNSDRQNTSPSVKHKVPKRNHDNAYSEIRSQKPLNSHQQLPNDFPMHLFASERPDKTVIPTTVTREEPTSTMNHENESNFKYDSNFRPERSSPTDSYDENDLDDIKEFAKSFKLRRLSMGLTQTQVGQALNITEGPAYSQSAICSALASHVYAAQIASQQHSIFEKLDITPKSAQKIKPVLERWMKEAEERYRNGQGLLTEFIGMESSKKRKRRTSFTPQALEILNSHFEHNTHPSGTEITALAHRLGYDREVIRIWFCNKRQALKNTVRMMSKHII